MGKLKKKAKHSQDEALRFEVRQEFHDSVDGVESSLGLKAPNVIGPMDGYANKINPEEDLNARKGKNVDFNNIVRKEKILTAYESANPFHAFERDSFKMMLEVVGQFGIGLPLPTRYALSDTLLKHEVEITKNLLKKNEQEWKEDGFSIMTDAWSDRKRRSSMNLRVNSKMGIGALPSTPKGITSYKTVSSVQFWSGVAQCLKVFSPLVKVLRMVDADWKPSMGFVYGEIKAAKEEIIISLGGNEKAYKPIIDIINKKMKGRLDSSLHLTSYLLNPYYHYKDPQLQYDPDIMNAVLDFFDTLLCDNFEMQRQVVTIDLPKYKKKVDRFGYDLAIKNCRVNDVEFDPEYRQTHSHLILNFHIPIH
uniref:DUF659 domain-containing protein n=1 Tax=Lactuca sativa TaxID=4236 RepID=A0A9R1XI16_LACSA|nr:hypothetical protein LSAT_V11C400217490 [Lactuca sativa]